MIDSALLSSGNEYCKDQGMCLRKRQVSIVDYQIHRQGSESRYVEDVLNKVITNGFANVNEQVFTGIHHVSTV